VATLSSDHPQSARAVACDDAICYHEAISRLEIVHVSKPRRLINNIDDLARRHAAGETILQLAREAGVSRCCLIDRLKSMGVEIRGQSDAMRIRWASRKLDRAAVERSLGAAWKAARGRTVRRSEVEARAITNAARLLHRGDHEDALASAIRMLGADVVQQQVVGPYNIDLALTESRVAVECVRSNPDTPRRSHESTRRERIEHVLDAGWRLVFVVTGMKRESVSYGLVAQHLVAWAKRPGRDEPARREYRVVGRDGQLVTTIDV